jgi:pilus assembly protein CpaF
LSIRRFGLNRVTVEDMLRLGSVTPDMVALMRAMVRARLNILVSGGTGSGKTTLLNCLSCFIPDQERIVTIEDSAELQLQQPHVVRLETRPPNVERRGEVTQRDLLRNSLRMRPDRIIIGEVRGAESLDMLQAMNTGHDGSISTIHANSARDSLNRLEMMVQMAGFNLPTRAMRQQISLALDVVIQTARLGDGSRKVTNIVEVLGMEGDAIQMQELFNFQRDGVDSHGSVTGRFLSSGIRPHFADRLKDSSHEIDPTVFDYLTS